MSEALHSPALRVLVLAVALIGGLDAIEEYFPVLAGDWGVPTAAVPVAVLVISLAGAAGAALGGRADRLRGGHPARAARGRGGAACAAAALWARPAALVAVAVFYALYLAVLVVAEARLQEPDRERRTARRSPRVAGLGIELASLLVFAAWAVGRPDRGRRPGARRRPRGPGRAAHPGDGLAAARCR